MRKEWLILLVIALLITIIVIIDWSKFSPKSNQTNESNSTNSDVTVAVEYLKDKSDDKNMVFTVTIDTHSVNLDAFNFEKDIVLEKDGKSTAPSKATTNGGGHHRSGEIVFPNTSPPFTMVLKNLANINRREFLFEKLQ